MDTQDLAPTAGPATGWRARLARLRERRAVRWGLEVAWIAVVLAAVGAFQARNHLDSGTAPDLTLPALDGGEVSLASLAGKPAMVVFWAPWCGVCKAQSDNVGRVLRLAGSRAHVVTVAAAYDDLAEVQAYVAERGSPYPVLLGGDEAVRAFRVEAFPTVYFLDARGRVKRSTAGYTTTAGMLLRLLF